MSTFLAVGRAREIFRFLVVGTIGFVVDAGVLLALVDGLGAPKIASRIPSFLIAATVTWWLHRNFTFEHARGSPPSFVEWLRFLLANALGNLVNLGVYAALVALGGMAILPAVAAASVVAAAVNWAASSRWVFRRS